MTGLWIKMVILLPILSKSSSNVNIQKLLDAPLPDFSKETPGSPFWTKFGMFLLTTGKVWLIQRRPCIGN